MALPSTQLPSSVGSSALMGRMRGVLSGFDRIAQQPAMRRAMPSILIVTVTALAIGVWLLLRAPAVMTLYPGLAEAEKSRVVETLSAAGISASVNGTTGEVEVPRADYYKARMALAAQGLPEAVPDGSAVITDLPMGASHSVESARLRQAQELDLARSITEIDSISSARVHLALPERSAFLRDTQPPRASVFLQLVPGRVLDSGQVEAIVNLVSSAVPGMAREDVTVVDQMGQLLSRGADDPGAMLNDRQMQQRLQMETLYRNRIEELLTPILGPGNLSVQVTLDMDFTKSEITEEKVDPNGSVLRSETQQTSEDSGPQARGIPGAVSNTPPPAPQMTTGAAPAAAAAPAPAPDAPTTRTSDVTRNFDVSRTVQTTQPATAQIKRIAAAIVVRAKPADGAAADAPLLPAKQMADLQALAQSAIGFDASRGDQLTIQAQTFADEVQAGVSSGSASDWLPEATRQVALILALAIVALGIVRPLLMRLMPGSDGATANMSGQMLHAVEVAEGETLEDVQARLEQRRQKLAETALGAGATRDEKFAILRQLATDDPTRIATVLQRMMKDEIEKMI